MKNALALAAFCVALVFAASPPAKADGTSVPDPVMAPKKGGGCGSTHIKDLTFTFSGSESSTSVDCFIASAASPSLTVGTTLTPVQVNQLTTDGPCGQNSGYNFSGSDLFTTVVCKFNSVSDQLTVTWLGTGSDCKTCQNFPGIQPSVDFFMDFSGWSSSPNQSFTGELAVPEPGTMFLLALGLGVTLVVSRSKFVIKTAAQKSGL